MKLLPKNVDIEEIEVHKVISDEPTINKESKSKKILSPEEKHESINTELNPKKDTIHKKHWFRYILLAVVVILLLIGSFFVTKFFIATNSLQQAGVDVSVVDALKQIVAPVADLKMLQDGDLTNSLFVGIDSRTGSGSDGLENTDSIIIASFNHKTNKTTLISIPRDNQALFRVGKDNKTIIYDRINAAYYLAETYKYPTGGLGLLRVALTEITGLQIQYTAQVNFLAFKDIVNRIGGITVNVERAFTDYEYPTDNYGIQTVKFNAGVQQMNGDTALKYARSRHAAGIEGSDFSRAQRQQNVIAAIQDKIKQTNFITDPTAFFDFISIFGANVKIQKTENSAAAIQNLSLKDDDIPAALKLKDKIDSKNFVNIVLDPTIGGTDALIHRLYTTAYLIGPTLGTGKYDDIKKYVSFALNNPDVYVENRFSYDTPKKYAEVGFVDNGVGNTKAKAEVKSVQSSFISSTFLLTVKDPILLSTTTTTPATGTTSPGTKLTGVGIYDSTGTKPATLNYLKTKYNATLLTADQVPASIKNLKGYDIILVFAP